MCGVGQNLVTAQVVLPEANFNIFYLMLRKEKRRDKNDNKKGHSLAMEFTRKTFGIVGMVFSVIWQTLTNADHQFCSSCL